MQELQTGMPLLVSHRIDFIEVGFVTQELRVEVVFILLSLVLVFQINLAMQEKQELVLILLVFLVLALIQIILLHLAYLLLFHLVFN